MAEINMGGLSKGKKRDHADDIAPLPSKSCPPTKKTKLLDSDESGEESDDQPLKVNEEYARRFEYNKKREEKHRLEEKYGKSKALQDEDENDSEDSEEGVEEDDAGEFATEALDQEISATLQALRSKDPRIYDSKVNFFAEIEGSDADTRNGIYKEESMTLKQYHTKNLLDGSLSDMDEAPRQTYAQEQEEARQNLVKEMHAVGESGDDDDDDDDFLVAKSRSDLPPSKDRIKITAEDVEKADRDPETFLSNFMASRAWVPKGDSRFQPLESDDEDEDAAAEEWENSYNMYFEDTTGANEKLVTYARDAVAKTTVRRDEQSSRRKARDAARAKREAERKEREDDLARLRKLKIDEMEQKVNKIRETGGLKGRDFNVGEWKDVLEADWSDDQWDMEMQKRFGESYYEDNDAASASDEPDDARKRKKPKKPKFDDDIDIKDLIPNFQDEGGERPNFTLSSDDENPEASAEDDEAAGINPSKNPRQRKQERAEAKSAARRDRRLIENLVNDSLQYEAAMASSSKTPARFRYRETSPTTFGMTARDILLASDQQLNEFAGLKKLATFRDPVKKQKDKKHLSKKARLRKWRMDTFGDMEGPKGGFEALVAEVDGSGDRETEANIKESEGKKKRKRSRKGNATTA